MYNTIFDGEPVTLIEMLDAREERLATQKKMLSNKDERLICATMNIPGPIKSSPILVDVFSKIIQQVKQQVSNSKGKELSFYSKKTGPEYYFTCSLDSVELKKRMVSIEETHPYGRLVDLDVHWLQGGTIAAISRADLDLRKRRCLVCQKDAKECGRARVHSIVEMQEKISQIIQNGGECKDEEKNSLYGNRAT
ncbi:citrate lyase holo-[acyl-carrier protein] synthase [Enterococcus italicus]|uniref:citrate lyase holo-[acyl-carrier protein] synthase n=1 Tax=Enterococcus italicus TaxID=246144 RepID=UPI002073CD34|nr:citrate lyase holo-[acyl-carrier protein] synthase [Enterococcus italicus]MCM6932214.1 citrate lyase holo-[acyl-carrier protein] synthase [Enterococcus italicus]